MKVLLENWKKFVNEEQSAADVVDTESKVTGVILNADQAKNLLNELKNQGVLEPEQGWTFIAGGGYNLPHHMTIVAFKNLNKIKEKNPNEAQMLESVLGQQIEMQVNSFGTFEDKVFAVQVGPTSNPASQTVFKARQELTKSDPKIGVPHISTALKNGGKAFESNNIKEWTPLQTPFTVVGTLKQAP